MVLTENDVRAFDFLGYWVERFTVNTTEDTVDVNPGDGICADSSGNCSLRAAIMEANTLPAAAIVLQSGQTYTLSLDNRATPGDGPTADEDDLDIRSEIIIQGNGATIQRDPTLRCHLNRVSNTGEFRIFEVTGTGDLTLQNVTVRNGCADGSVDFGGGILVYSNGTLNAMGSTISGNSAGSGGGGIGNFGIATITNSTISGNSASGSGGGIWNFDTVTITNSTISGNSAGSGGGGIDNESGTLNVTGSTISGNSASDSGGGIDIDRGTVTITNSTISGNSAGSFGGGIRNFGGTANLSFVTIASNSASIGGGISRAGGTVNIKNSIVGNNTASTGPNCSGGVTATGANFATDGSCGAGFSTVPSTGLGGLNLGPLANNGGPTQTHALQAGSAAIDAVPSGQCSDVNGNPVIQDQRGVSRPQGSRCDVGAYEAAAASTQAVTLEGGGDRLQLDLQNQTYRFRTSTNVLFTGSLRVTRRGSVIQFNSLPGETGILEGTVNLIPGRGQAVLRTFFPRRTFSITDPNLSDNTCVP
jgi:CSLREA domain-containing protein